MTFSERMGYIDPRESMQVESLDERTRTRIWNLFSVNFHGNNRFEKIRIYNFLKFCWGDHFVMPIDNFKHVSQGIDLVRSLIFKGSINSIFDYLEWTFTYEDMLMYPVLQEIENIFTKECVGYKIIEKLFVPIANNEEIGAIDEAINGAFNGSGISEHIATALQLFADRESPDYRNSIKESISAVESAACIITDNPHASLGQALKVIQAKHGLHKALEEGFSKIYGYTSNADGIRHGMMDEGNLTADDAKFMLVACSAFVNYLMATCLKD